MKVSGNELTDGLRLRVIPVTAEPFLLDGHSICRSRNWCKIALSLDFSTILA